MSLTARIAWRYLRKKKSHGAVSAIAIVAVTGVAVATAAILCVLSVFNGFHTLLLDYADNISPDIEVTPASGKVIDDADMLCMEVAELKGVKEVMPVVEDQALVIYEGKEMPVMLRGIDPASFRQMTAIDSLIIAGGTLPEDAIEHDPPLGLMSVGVGMSLRAFSPGEDRLFLFAPRREGRINVANPLASFHTDSVTVAGVFRSNKSEIDGTTLYVPIDVARGLFEHDIEATAVHIKVKDGEDPAVVAEYVARFLNDDPTLGRPEGFKGEYVVKDKGRLQEVNYRMVEIEKWVTALLLLFILIIASFNIISALTMFVLEKRKSLRLLRALGMARNAIGRIFAWQSMMINAIGGVVGLALGWLAVTLQSRYGFITMDAGREEPLPYPVAWEWNDVLYVAAAIFVIAAITSLIAYSFARSRISEKRR